MPSRRPRRRAAELGEKRRRAEDAESAEAAPRKKRRGGGSRGKKKKKKSKSKKKTSASTTAQNRKWNAEKARRSKVAMQTILMLNPRETLELENFVYDLTKGFVCVLNKKLWTLLIKKHGWDQPLTGRTKESRLNPKPVVANGTLSKGVGKGKQRAIGALVAELGLEKLSEEDQKRAEQIGFIIDRSKGVVSEHHTNAKTSFARQHMQMLVMQKFNTFFKASSSSKAAKTSLCPGVHWMKETKKWYTRVRNPATGKQDATGEVTECEATARDRALAKYDLFYNKPEYAKYRTYVRLYDEDGEFKPKLITMAKMSDFIKLARPEIMTPTEFMFVD